MPENVILTDHAEDRIRKRCGVPRKAAQRRAQRAWDEGISLDDAEGPLLNYMQTRYTDGDEIRVWDGDVWIFDRKRLITVFQLPTGLRGEEVKLRKAAAS